MPSLTIDAEKERTPPPQPTPLQFPNYDGLSSLKTETPPEKLDCDSLCDLLSRIKKPQDINEDYLKALNVSVDPNVIHASDIVPGGILKSRSPYQWPGKQSQDQSGTDEEGKDSEADQPLPSGGFAFPDREKYDSLRSEILIDNEDAFRSLARVDPLPGGKKVRITYSRKFWTGLEQMAQYWDTSLDQYYERAPGSESKEDEFANDNETSKMATGDDDDKMDIDPNPNQPAENDTSKAGSESPKPAMMYKGRRIGSGKDMPESARDETLRGFIETVAWPFGCQVKIPNMPPRLSVKSMLFPTRHTFVVSRVPQDRQIARKSVLEGPVVVGQCRGETAFPGDDVSSQFKYVQVCDVLREVAGMLLCAQERARDGLVEVKPGEGEWWTTEPRWGGAQNDGPVGTPIDCENGGATNDGNGGSGDKPSSAEEPKGSTANNSTADAAAADPATGAAQTSNKRTRHDRNHYMRRSSSSSKKLSMFDKWKVVQPGHGLWDKKMKYLKIGGDKDKPYDDVSSIRNFITLSFSSADICLTIDLYDFSPQPPHLNRPPARPLELPRMASEWQGRFPKTSTRLRR